MTKSFITAAALALLAVGAAQADTLAKIKQSGAVSMGVRESSGALSYTLGNNQFAGFHVEICQRVLEDVRKQLGLAKLDVKYVPVTSQNRIPLVQNGTVDIECGSTTNHTARQQQVAFAVTTCITEARFAVRANSASRRPSTCAARRCRCGWAGAAARPRRRSPTSRASTVPSSRHRAEPGDPGHLAHRGRAGAP